MTQSTHSKVVIVGGGSAGTSSAAELARYGIKSLIIDEAPKIGGVVYRGPLRKSDSLPHFDPNLKRSMAALHTRYKKNKEMIDLSLETTVLGPSGDSGLLVLKEEKVQSVDYDALILSTGCHERSVPFPGWQLPGIMMLGGVQLQIKSGLVRPGNRMAIVGTGPLLPLVAVQLHKSGVDVVGVYEASAFGRLAKEAVALLNKPQLTLSGISMLAYLKKYAIPFHFGWGIVEAKGSQEVSKIVVAPYDEQWRPDRENAKTIEVDAVGVGYGFVSRSQLSQVMGLEHEYQDMSGYTPIVDQWQMSSKERVYVAGDSSGILGADGAICEGQIAATRIAQQFGQLSDREAAQRIDKITNKLNRVKRFRFGFDRFSERKSGLLDLPRPDTIVCRCENVSRQKIDKAIADGVSDVTTLKMRTRIGMGDCQGKTCASYCYDRLKQENLLEKMGAIRPRFPLDPIPFAAMEEN